MTGPWIIPAGGGAGGAVSSASQITRSLRLRASATAFLTRTPAATGNQKKWTWAGWVKRSAISVDQTIFTAWSADTDTGFMEIKFNSNDTISLGMFATVLRTTTAVYRDPSAPMFILCALDAANTTCRIEVNGVPVTAWQNINPVINQNYAINGAIVHNIGRRLINSGPLGYVDGYMADCYFIDGQYLDSSSFGQIDSTTGVWMPKTYTGGYGANGFHLDFADNSNVTATTLGRDVSGNANNWTPINFSVTAGTANDSFVDTPTNYGNDTGVGGEVRGNYATFNPITEKNGKSALSQGNLHLVAGSGWTNAPSTIAPQSGKWYYEVTLGNGFTSGFCAAVIYTTMPIDGDLPGSTSGSPGWSATPSTSGNSNYFNAASATGVALGNFVAGDRINVLVDTDIGKVWFGRNGVIKSIGGVTATPADVLAGNLFAFSNLPIATPLFLTASATGANDVFINHGQRPWADPSCVPTGFKALCTQNLSTPSIIKSQQYMDVNLRGGTGAAFSVTGKSLQPDFTWIKSRSGSTDHAWYDVVRGVQKDMGSNIQNAETTEPQGVTAFNSDGFSGGTLTKLNASGGNFADWLWKKGVVPGFDIQLFTTTGAAMTFNHNLGVVPALIIMKARNAAGTNWVTYHKNMAAVPQQGWLDLGAIAAYSALAGIWNNTAPTATTVTIGSAFSVAGWQMVSYLFAEVPGFSKFGSYIGNGNADGPLVWCGFRPRWLMIKRVDVADSWMIINAAIDSINPASHFLLAENAVGEAQGSVCDLLATGFKVRNTSTTLNTSGGVYIFIAFAESPLKYVRAR